MSAVKETNPIVASIKTTGPKRPRRIEQQSAPGEPREIDNANARNDPVDALGFPLAKRFRRQQLTQRSSAIVQPGSFGSMDVNLFCRDIEFVSFLPKLFL